MDVRTEPASAKGSRHRLLLSAVFLVLWTVPVSCPGKRSSPAVSLTIHPQGLVGLPDDPVQFSVVSDPPVDLATFGWGFGDGATTSTSTDPAPTVTLRAPGSYAVSKGDTLNELLQGEYVVGGVPVVTGVSPTGAAYVLGAGCRGLPDSWNSSCNSSVEVNTMSPLIGLLPDPGDITGSHEQHPRLPLLDWAFGTPSEKRFTGGRIGLLWMDSFYPFPCQGMSATPA